MSLFLSLLSTFGFVLNLDTTTQIVEYLNVLRNRHRAPNVSWSADLEKYAYDHATVMATTRNFQHSVGPYGENIAWLGYPTNSTKSFIRAIDLWYSESLTYNYSTVNPRDGLHFSQLVWSGTERVGGAIVQGYVVMEFNPRGNYLGSFGKNVFPALDIEHLRPPSPQRQPPSPQRQPPVLLTGPPGLTAGPPGPLISNLQPKSSSAISVDLAILLMLISISISISTFSF